MAGVGMGSKDRWDKLAILAKATGAIAIPVILLLIAHDHQSTTAERALQTRQFELAVDILQSKPQDDRPNILREWAVEKFRQSVPLSDHDADALLTDSLPIQESALPESLTASADSCCVACNGGVWCGMTVETACGSCSVF
jgi:hypothetical protein